MTAPRNQFPGHCRLGFSLLAPSSSLRCRGAAAAWRVWCLLLPAAVLALSARAETNDLLRLLNPRSETTSTTRAVAHILGRTAPDAKVTVAGEPAAVFATGIFVRDNVALQMGENRLTIIATAPDGRTTERTVTLTRLASTNAAPAQTPTAPPPEADTASSTPDAAAQPRLARVKAGGAALSFGVHQVRLGGPYLAEVGAGTWLRVIGTNADNAHVQLSADMDAWVASQNLEWAPAAAPAPHLAFTSLSVEGNDTADQVLIPYDVPVPFAVTPTFSPSGRAALDLDFFGAHNAATWLSHHASAKTVREVTVEQIASEHLRVCVELTGQQLWGYQCLVTNGTVVLTIRRAPKLAPAPDSPLKGLTVALEAGHGGGDSGARGVSGSEEKEVNRLAVAELACQFEAAGAKVVLMRPGDESLRLPERVRRAVAANADLAISVHANSGGGRQAGYLSTSGTSTYYKWSFSRDFAAAIHARLLEFTHLPDFGNVGNFNYHPLRANTWMPAMLVEQAFMSNPADEAKLLDPAFRKHMMQAVVQGTEDWLKSVRP